MISFNSIKHVHLEISSLCNAMCPCCLRTFWGYPYNGGYPETNLSLEQAQKIFQPDFLKQLTGIYINGNFGDIVMNPEGPDIVDYFLKQNPKLTIKISTNGSAKDQIFWTRLAHSGATVSFCLDGLSDTHHLYRQNTSWKTIIKNANIFINAGGKAVWKMIQFDHNRHQIDQCRQMSKTLGFIDFNLVLGGRDTAPVFNKHGKLMHVLGNYTGEKDFEVLFYKKKTDQVMVKDITKERTPSSTINCIAKNNKSIYISANGEVSPCCFTGVYPKSYGKGQYYEAANSQLVPLINKNNALTHSLEECIEWFNQIEQSWDIPTFEHGRLVICNDNCGQN